MIHSLNGPKPNQEQFHGKAKASQDRVALTQLSRGAKKKEHWALDIDVHKTHHSNDQHIKTSV